MIQIPSVTTGLWDRIITETTKLLDEVRATEDENKMGKSRWTFLSPYETPGAPKDRKKV